MGGEVLGRKGIAGGSREPERSKKRVRKGFGATATDDPKRQACSFARLERTLGAYTTLGLNGDSFSA